MLVIMLYLDSKPEAKLITIQMNQSQMNQLIQSSLLMNGLNGSELLVTPFVIAYSLKLLF